MSQVSFYTGQCLDLHRLAAETSRRGVLLAVDATHGSGVVEVPAGLTDLCVSSSYKWMLATHGVAPCYLSPRAENRTAATCFGWRNLVAWAGGTQGSSPGSPDQALPEKMEPGNPSLVSVMFLNNALDVLLRTGMDPIQEHAGSCRHGLRPAWRSWDTPSSRPENPLPVRETPVFCPEKPKPYTSACGAGEFWSGASWVECGSRDTSTTAAGTWTACWRLWQPSEAGSFRTSQRRWRGG